MFEWLKVSEFWYGTIAGSAVSLGIKYLLLLRKEAGEERRDSKKRQSQLDDEARLRWNDSIQKLKDFLAILMVQMSQAQDSYNSILIRQIRAIALRDWPYLAIFRLSDGNNFWGGDESDDTLFFMNVFHNFEVLHSMFTSWHADPATKAKIYSIENDREEFFALAKETFDMLKFK